jgi:hypothetical protein
MSIMSVIWKNTNHWLEQAYFKLESTVFLRQVIFCYNDSMVEDQFPDQVQLNGASHLDGWATIIKTRLILLNNFIAKNCIWQNRFTPWDHTADHV